MKSTQKLNRTGLLAGTAIGIAMALSAYANPGDYGQTEEECHAYNAAIDEEAAPLEAWCNTDPDPVERQHCLDVIAEAKAGDYHDCGC